LSQSFSIVHRILGLAFPALSNFTGSPFFQTAVSDGVLSQAAFAFKLADTGSSLFLGGVDNSLYTGSIEYHDLSSSNGFWQIGGATISIGGTSAVSGIETVIDSGATLIYGPPSAVKQFYAKVSGAQLYDSENGFYSFPCNSVPSTTFNWGGQSWAVSSDKWVILEIP
jgi:cathepsin D